MTAPKTVLKPTAVGTFAMPAMWSFPPFFTLQPNPATRAHQLKLWSELVLAWARHTRTFSVNGDSPEPGEVFGNKAIGRTASPDPPKQTASYLLYWRKPDEWGQIIYDWVDANGLLGTIMTFYEITDGDLSHTTEFRELPGPLLRRALDTLVRRGKAQILRDGDGDGVRFL